MAGKIISMKNLLSSALRASRLSRAHGRRWSHGENPELPTGSRLSLPKISGLDAHLKKRDGSRWRMKPSGSSGLLLVTGLSA